MMNRNYKMANLTWWGRSRRCGRPWRCGRRCSCRRGRDRSVGRMGRKWTSLDRSQWRWPPDDKVIWQHAWNAQAVEVGNCNCIGAGSLWGQWSMILVWEMNWTEISVNSFDIFFGGKTYIPQSCLFERNAVSNYIIWSNKPHLHINMFSELNWKVAPRFVFGDLHHHNISFSTV